MATINVSDIELDESELHDIYSEYTSDFRDFVFDSIDADYVIDYYEEVGLETLVKAIDAKDLWSAMTDEQLEHVTNDQIVALKTEIRMLYKELQSAKKNKAAPKKRGNK
jgi:hypothetical protein